MPDRCCVPKCRSNYDKTGVYVSSFIFPKDPNRKQLWIEKIQRRNWTPSPRTVVCEKHFVDSDIIRIDEIRDRDDTILRVPRQKPKLKEDACPRLFANCPEFLTKTKPDSKIDISEKFQEARNIALSIFVKNNIKLESPDLDNDEENSSSHEPNFQGHQRLEPQVRPSLLQETSQASASVPHASSSIPASQNWPGEFKFKVSFSLQEKNTKGVAWTYSQLKDKLYVGKDVACPVNFAADAILPNDVVIRAMAVYTSSGSVSEVVRRCVNHSMEEMKNGVFEAEHLIRCENSNASYHIDAVNNRHSVVVPFENPPDGQDFTTCIYKFACFGSCAGGPNRRALMLIFTLEKGNQVIGRRKLDVKICACPGRDRKIEEGQLGGTETSIRRPLKRKEPSDGAINIADVLNITKHFSFPHHKKPKVCPNKDGVYVIEVEDKSCYEFLIQMKRLYEMCKMLTGLSPDVTKTLLYYQRKKTEEKE